jgi:hypothetical protein
MEPLLSATERGEVVMFPPLDADLYGSKGALALLSEPANQIGLTPEERDACTRLLPWTRPVRAGKTTVEDGRRVDLLAYTLENQEDLVLKPSLSYGGTGVVVGADPDITPQRWRNLLTQAVNDAYVVQRRVRPLPDLFPSTTPGNPAPWTVVWGVFTMWQGFAGVCTRAVPADAQRSTVNFEKGGAYAGCGFHPPVMARNGEDSARAGV